MSAPEHPDEESEGARAERHRSAERRHWFFEKIGGSVALGFTAIAAIGAILSAIAGFRAYDAANRAVQAALDANQIAIRPYIKIDLLPDTFEITSSPIGRSLAMQFTIENTGKLPAPAHCSEWNCVGR